MPDEIGELCASFQPLLLRLPEEEPETGPGLSVIALTNRVLLDEVEAGRFRRDLFYRLGQLTLTVPPPADRGDDILLIAQHYNRKYAAETGREPLSLRSDAQEALMTHPWPGNVRELRNVIPGLHVLSKSRSVTAADAGADGRRPGIAEGRRKPDDPRRPGRAARHSQPDRGGPGHLAADALPQDAGL